MRLDQRLAHRQGALACGERLVKPPRPTEHVRRVGLAVRQGIPVFGGCRAGLGELLPDRLFPRVVADRLVRFSGLRELPTDVEQAVRQIPLKLWDGGVVVGQLLSERQCLAVLGLRFR